MSLIIITGPTAVGKTAFSIRLARHFGTEIISADSRQFYSEMRIGTAFPTPEELSAVRHHFVGNLSVKDEYNVARYEQEVLEKLRVLFGTHDAVVMCGGSGLYIDAVCRGIDDLPDHDPSLRETLKEELAEKGLEAMVEKLETLDPEYAEIVDRRNPNRVLRALEVCLQTGTTYSSMRKNVPRQRPFHIIRLGLDLPREELFRRIETRVDAMMAGGLLDEARALLPFRHLNALNTVGYKELFAFMDGNISLEQAIADIKTNTRRYARRQLTWFRRDKDMAWFSPDDFEGALEYVNSALQQKRN
jgi:tRNA dimethylallyltransferase